MKNYKKIAALTLLVFAANISLLFGQRNAKFEVTNNDIESFRKLHIKPNIEFFIPAGEYSDPLPVNFNIEGQYWLGTRLDARAGLKIGSLKGVSLGGTWHLKDRIADKPYKFILSRTTSSNGKNETVKYLKVPLKARLISGPCADIFIGNLKGGGFNAQLAFGLDFQKMMRGSGKPEGFKNAINSSGNGWYSLKIQGVVQSLTAESDVINYLPVVGGREMGFGAQADVNAVVKPWNGASLFAGLQMGALKVTGPTGSIKPIFSFRLGVAICK
ncbi:MAG: hypothetical protein SGJ00_03500 [bacterium]|nr:hypothetical protein [bacterium]